MERVLSLCLMLHRAPGLGRRTFSKSRLWLLVSGLQPGWSGCRMWRATCIGCRYMWGPGATPRIGPTCDSGRAVDGSGRSRQWRLRRRCRRHPLIPREAGMDEAELKARLHALKEEHRDLDAAIDAL